MTLAFVSVALHTEELVELDLWSSLLEPATMFAGPGGTTPDESLDFDNGAWRAHSRVTPGHYRHHKGKFYQVVGLAYRLSTNERLVAYKALYQSKYDYFLRPESMFLDVVRDGVTRFAKI